MLEILKCKVLKLKGLNMKTNSNIAIYLVLSLVVGFLLLFFYQTMVDSQITKFKEDYQCSCADYYGDNFLLLKGWKAKKENGINYASMDKDRAVFIFSLPSKNAVSLAFKLRFHDPGQEIKVYVEQKLAGVLRGNKIDEWEEQCVIINARMVKDGLNKIELKKTKKTKPDFGSIKVMNYQKKKLIFLRAYVVWESTKWFRKRGGISVNWNICILGSIILCGVWLAYSTLFWSITKEKYLRILRLDFWTYLLPVFIFSILFLFSKFVSSHTFFYYKFDFFLILIGSMCVGKIYQMTRYTKKDMCVLRLKQLYECTIKKYNVYANVFICLFIVMMLICAGMLMFELKLPAEWLANVAFFILIIGFLIKLIKYFVEKQYNME